MARLTKPCGFLYDGHMRYAFLAKVHAWIAMAICLVSLSACEKAAAPALPPGTWRCSDLTQFEHVSQFAAYVLVIHADDRADNYLVDSDGSHVQEQSDVIRRYEDIITFGEGGSWFKPTVDGDTLVLEVVSAVEPSDVGMRLVFKRVADPSR